MKLFHSPASPYVRKVMVTAWERGVQDQIEILASAAGPIQRDATIVAVNSTGKVPCAITPTNRPLFDSRVITQYVDQLSSTGTSVYPEQNRFDILTLEALADSLLDACLLCRYEEIMRPNDKYWDEWYQAQMAKIDSGLDDLESEWFGFLNTDHFHAGSIAVACFLGYLDFRFPNKDWRSSHPQLSAWFKQVSERASMQETFPQG